MKYVRFFLNRFDAIYTILFYKRCNLKANFDFSLVWGLPSNKISYLFILNNKKYSMRNHLFFLLGLFVLLNACDKQDDFTTDFKYEYFPLEIGKYITYSVDSIIYSTFDGNISIDTGSYQIRETIVDSSRQNSIGKLVYEIERERRKDASEAWKIESVLVVHQAINRLEWTEDNRKFVKMVFPLKLGETWDGNQYFDETEPVSIKGEVIEMFKGWDYEITTIDESYTVSNFDFDQTMVVSQANSENAIEYRYSTERYAKGIGLIEKEIKILDTQCITDCIGQNWEEKAEKGFILKMRMIDHN